MLEKNKFYKKILIIILVIAISASVFVYFKIAQGAVTIGGDVYSGGNLGSNISVANNSIASASGTVEAGGTNYKLPGINIDTSVFANTTEMITKLKKLSAQRISNDQFGTTAGNTELNGINKFPEGTVWYRKGDLKIVGGGTFSGKGTIIVENGNLTIAGDIKYKNPKTDSIGFIVTGTGDKGNIIIKNNVKKLRGAYFTTGTITIEQ